MNDFLAELIRQMADTRYQLHRLQGHSPAMAAHLAASQAENLLSVFESDDPQAVALAKGLGRSIRTSLEGLEDLSDPT